MNENKDTVDQGGSLVHISEEETRYHVAPVTDLAEINRVREEVKRLVAAQFKENTHYGKIPGTNNKNVLLLPGAQKLSEFFGFYPDPVPLKEVEDWDREPPLFDYTYKVYLKLQGDGRIIAAGIGNCNSWESKYKYRQDKSAMQELGGPECPDCNAPILARSKQKDERTGDQGYYCWQKKGGCGSQFHSQDPRVKAALAYHQSARAAANKKTEKIINPDIADCKNTVLKMAKKRAFIDACITAVHVSDMFTQDILQSDEDDTVDAEIVPPKQTVDPDKELGTEGFNNLFNALKARKRTKAELSNLLSLAGVVNASLDHEKYAPELMAVFAILRHNNVEITRVNGATVVKRLTNRVFEIAYQALCA